MGGDTISIQLGQAQGSSDSIACPLDAMQSGTCRFYIGVRGFEASSFIISAMIDKAWESPMRLLAGKALVGTVNASRYRYYSFNVPQDAMEVHISLTPLTVDSDPDLFVIVDQPNRRVFPGSSLENATHAPGENFFDVKSTTWMGDDEVILSPGDTHWCKAFPCMIYIAVKGYNYAEFSIRASTNQVTLTPDKAVRSRITQPSKGGSEPGLGYAYFTLRVDDPHANITITAAPITDSSTTPSIVVHRVCGTGGYVWAPGAIAKGIDPWFDPKALIQCGTYKGRDDPSFKCNSTAGCDDPELAPTVGASTTPGASCPPPATCPSAKHDWQSPSTAAVGVASLRIAYTDPR